MRLTKAGAFAAALLIFVGLAWGAQAQTADLFKGFQTNSKDPVKVDADSLETYEQGTQRITVFSGGVTVIRGPTTLKAAEIRLFSNLNSKDSKSAFTRIEANGTVFVKSGDQTVTGGKAVVDMATQIITLTGSVVLSQGGSVMTGDRLTVDLKSGRARLEQAPGKRIQGVFSPETIKSAAPPKD